MSGFKLTQSMLFCDISRLRYSVLLVKQFFIELYLFKKEDNSYLSARNICLALLATLSSAKIYILLLS